MGENHTTKIEKPSFDALMDYIRRTENGKMNVMLEGGLRFADEESKTVTWEFPIKEWELNSHGGLHGGIIASMMDYGMGFWAQYFCDGGTVATASLTVNYLKPFPADDTVILTAQIVSAGRRIISATADAYIKSSGQMAATALATYARIPRVK
ncbi:MAG: PaaI family thioesterase [Firmicutes bacterium]|nr:PaaI family thioesterase [Clostridiales bacterium]MBQ9931359.1 PaaI family thioesterase [Bacillota bacterium]